MADAGTAAPSADMRAVLARIAELRADAGDRYAMPFEAARAQLLRERAWWLEDAPAVATVDRVGPAPPDDPSRAVRLRDYLPADPAGAGARCLYLHGGGWCVGSIDTHDAIMRRLAVASGRPVTGVDYALAPEHPFPAAAEDVRRILASERAAAPSGTRWVLAGDSAGANLALLEAMRARDAGDPPVDALLLFYGCYGPVTDTASMRAFGDGRWGLSRAALARYEDAYLGGRAAADVPAAHPLSGAAGGLPPAWIAAAALDPLRDDSILLHAAITRAGGRSIYREFAGVVHGFLSYARMLPDAVRAIDEAAAFANRKLC